MTNAILVIVFFLLYWAVSGSAPPSITEGLFLAGVLLFMFVLAFFIQYLVIGADRARARRLITKERGEVHRVVFDHFDHFSFVGGTYWRVEYVDRSGDRHSALCYCSSLQSLIRQDKRLTS